MLNGKTILAIIPARGGSKGLPGKNIKLLCGKPLIAWSIESGLGSKYLDDVMVTTDSQEIADVARQYGASVPFLRPAELASDTATSFDVVKHTIDFYVNELGQRFDYVVLIEPTSPLRENNDIDRMLEKIISVADEYDAIISLGEVHEHPAIMKRTVGEGLQPYRSELVMATRRQDNDKAYFPYGVAYIARTDSLLQQKTFYVAKATYFFIKRYQCYEIDDIYDFLAIENILKYQRGSI